MFATENSTITVIIKTPKVAYHVGDTIDLECKVWKTSKPIFAQWIKHAGDVFLENATIPPATEDSPGYRILRHKINKVSLDQSGTYICKAEILNSSKLYKAYYALRVRGDYHYNNHYY